MSWEKDEPDVEPVEQTADLTPADEPEEDDPLAALEPEVREKAEARIQAKVRAEFDTKFEKDRAALNRVYGAAQKDAEAKGFKIVQGEITITDPAKAAQWLGVTEKPAEKVAANPADPADERVEEWDTAEVARAKMDRRQQRLVDAAVAKATAELQQQLAQVTGHVSQQQIGGAVESALPFLEELNVGYLAETPAFKQAFAQAMAGVPIPQRSDPLTIETAASMAIPAAKRWAAENGVKPPKDDDARRTAVADHQRAQLTRTGASRGTPGADAVISPQDRSDWDFYNRVTSRTLTQKEFLALRDGTDASGSEYAAAKGRR